MSNTVLEPVARSIEITNTVESENTTIQLDPNNANENSNTMKETNESTLMVKITGNGIIDDNNEDPTVFPDTDVSTMLQGAQFDGTLPSVTDRYFTPFYCVDVQRPRDDICIRVHSNRICMISLAPTHTVLEENKKIKSISFKVSDKLDRASNKVSGKGKHGAQPLQPSSNICSISCYNGEAYMIKCCITGKLVEVNELLLEHPEALLEPPHKGGYLAIALPNLKLLEAMKESWLTQEAYESFILERQNKADKDNIFSNTSEELLKQSLKRKRDPESLTSSRENKITRDSEANKNSTSSKEIT
ncbi:protein Simiate [Cephus cinctus]|uniref:Protein Simiate n=1 Tax=Cephus cinctus TaxID=211228 RepID=A0AAJ7C323_CEPCN|nr:protein Simiate [Cephus cinctus]